MGYAHPSSLMVLFSGFSLPKGENKQTNKSIKYTKKGDKLINTTSIPNKYATQKLLNRKCHTENIEISD